MIKPATKTKRALLRNESMSPPREIRDNTKVRRAWLAEKLAEVNAKPNREAKIVGTGSYQSLSVYEVKEVEGRLRHRGTCQFCGNSQVVSNGVMVLHGYTRPGDGMVWGRCPGVGLPALNENKNHTEKWLSEAIAAHEAAKTEEAKTDHAQKRANEILYGTVGGQSFEPEAYRAKPASLVQRFRPTEEEKAAYKQAYNKWVSLYPLTAAYSKAKQAYEVARQQVWQTRSQRDHFQFLIDSKVFGTDLVPEIVT